jgi:hypothetical protein
MKSTSLHQVVSGGQTGVDRAALDSAKAAGLATGGWCPKGRIAEDGIIPVEYPLRETSTAIYSERTERNVIDSDGTLILYVDPLSGGTALTQRFAEKYCRPNLLCDLDSLLNIEEVIQWLNQNRIHILNIAGPRESGVPGIYQRAFTYLTELFSEIY